MTTRAPVDLDQHEVRALILLKCKEVEEKTAGDPVRMSQILDRIAELHAKLKEMAP